MHLRRVLAAMIALALASPVYGQSPDEQRKQLTGLTAPNPAAQPAPAGAMPGMGGGGMSDM